jgi:AbrB family looped-hinge helix DNA binding protein
LEEAYYQTTLSSRNQIVIPRGARETLGVKQGDRLLIVIRGNIVVLLPKPKNHAKVIQGIGREVYAADYLKKERKGWE